MFGVDQAVAVADTTLRGQIFSRIDVIGAKLGVAANHLWPVLVRQSYAYAWMDVVGALVAAVIVARLYSWIPTVWKKADNDDGYFFASVFVIAGTIGGSAITVICLLGAVGRFVNPEFYALRSVVEMLTRAK